MEIVVESTWHRMSQCWMWSESHPIRYAPVSTNKLLIFKWPSKISSKSILDFSAIFQEAKINILVAVLVRIMRNVSQHYEKNERAQHLQHFLHWMQFSSYLEEGRIKVYKKAKREFEKILERDRTGERPVYIGGYFGSMKGGKWKGREKEQIVWERRIRNSYVCECNTR